MWKAIISLMAKSVMSYSIEDKRSLLVVSFVTKKTEKKC